MEKITNENWSHTCFKSLQLRAFLSLGADPVLEENNEPTLLYLVTLTNHEHQEQFQKDFTTLEPALHFLNERYGHWDFFDGESMAEETGGCGTCEAK